MNKKTPLIILFIIIILVFAAFLIYKKGVFSKEILRLEIFGPEKAKTGEEVEYTLQYKNNGNFVLEKVKLIFELPENSLNEDGRTLIIKNLDDIYPGNQRSISFKTRLLGKEGDLEMVRATLSYVPKNITATYESNTSFITKIESTPITLDLDLPTKAEQGKNLQYSINYFSNIDYPLENLSIKVDSVPGFEITSSTPASLDNVEWKLPTLNKSEGGRIIISGKISNDKNQNLTFGASLGMWRDGKFIILKKTSVDVQIVQPLLLISQKVNGSDFYVASPGEVLNYQIIFRNIGNTPFDNLFAVVKIDSRVIDINSLQAGDGGQVQPNDNLIVWGYNYCPQLRRLGVQEEASINFSVRVKKEWEPLAGETDGATIITSVNISQITQKFTIKVNSGLMIFQKAYYQSFEIPNSGPVPPKVGKTTTYTINWEIKNYFSDVKNARVRATLPKNLILTGKIMPENELQNFSFDSVSREIVWFVGDVPSGTGVNGDPISLFFQVSLTPDNSQKGSIIPIIGEVQISGENQFTNTTITSRAPGTNTSLPDDFVHSGGGVVQ